MNPAELLLTRRLVSRSLMNETDSAHAAVLRWALDELDREIGRQLADIARVVGA